MRLDDLKGRGEREASIPAGVERELEILDAALRGEEIPAGMEGIEALVSDLRAERPEPEPRFEAELDAWAAAGFPRGERPRTGAAGGGAGASTGDLLARFRPGGRRGWAPIAAAVATLVVIGVSISQVGDFEGDDEPTALAPSEQGEAAAPSGGAAEESVENVPGALGNAAAEDSPESSSGESSLRDVDGALLESGTQFNSSRSEARSGANRGQEKRRVERDAQLTLAAPADEVADLSDSVIDVVEGANGVVLNARVTGTDDAARATLDVRVPSATLDDTLASLSELANVKSRTEDSQDITRSYVTAKDRLVGLRATRDNLAARIRAATTDAEVATLQTQLAGVNRQIADAKSELANVQTRARLATVTIVITSEGAGTSDDDGWSFGDALDDAAKVLEVAAGVALISAAVLLPLAIIAAIAYVLVAAGNRRARERALDE